MACTAFSAAAVSPCRQIDPAGLRSWQSGDVHVVMFHHAHARTPRAMVVVGFLHSSRPFLPRSTPQILVGPFCTAMP